MSVCEICCILAAFHWVKSLQPSPASTIIHITVVASREDWYVYLKAHENSNGESKLCYCSGIFTMINMHI